MKIFAPFIWLGRKLKAGFDDAMEELDLDNESYEEWIDRQW